MIYNNKREKKSIKEKMEVNPYGNKINKDFKQ